MTRATAHPQVMVALAGFVGAVNGTDVIVLKGHQFAADDQLVRKWPELFEPITLRSTEPRVEQATAAPGEKRGT